MVAMLTRDALLRHFRKGMYHSRDKRLHTLISYVLLLIVTSAVCLASMWNIMHNNRY